MAGANNAQQKARGWRGSDVVKFRVSHRGPASDAAMMRAGFSPAQSSLAHKALGLTVTAPAVNDLKKSVTAPHASMSLTGLHDALSRAPLWMSDTVFVSKAWEESKSGMTLPAFKSWLLDQHKKGAIRLVRADLPAAMPRDVLHKSITDDKYQFSLIKIPPRSENVSEFARRLKKYVGHTSERELWKAMSDNGDVNVDVRDFPQLLAKARKIGHR